MINMQNYKAKQQIYLSIKNSNYNKHQKLQAAYLIKFLFIELLHKIQRQTIKIQNQQILDLSSAMEQSTKNQLLSIIKIRGSNSPQRMSPTLRNIDGLKSSLSPVTNTININIKEQLIQSPRRDNSNNFSKFFKKVKFNQLIVQEIRTHQKHLKKNPRIKLIQNTQLLINPKSPSFERYILHSTKKLKIIAQNNNFKAIQNHPQINFIKNSNHFISLPQSHLDTSKSLKKQQRRGKTQNSNRIFKGIASRKQENHRAGRLSMELEKYRDNHFQNQQEFVQHKKINLYHSLIYGGNFPNTGLTMPLTQSLGGGYTKIDRSQFPQDGYSKIRVKNRQIQSRDSGYSSFPTKRAQSNEPEVLTIHIRRHQTKSRQIQRHRNSLNIQRTGRQYYHPRVMPSPTINIFKRPNTTLANAKKRRDSQIEPW